MFSGVKVMQVDVTQKRVSCSMAVVTPRHKVAVGSQKACRDSLARAYYAYTKAAHAKKKNADEQSSEIYVNQVL